MTRRAKSNAIVEQHQHTKSIIALRAAAKAIAVEVVDSNEHDDIANQHRLAAMGHMSEAMKELERMRMNS